MNYATKWKALEIKKTELAAALRAAFPERASAREVLAPQFAEAYGEKLTSEGNFARGAKSSAKRAMNALLRLAYTGQKKKNGRKEGGAKASSPYELLITYITNSGLPKAKCLKAVEKAFAAE